MSTNSSVLRAKPEMSGAVKVCLNLIFYIGRILARVLVRWLGWVGALYF